MNFSDLCSAWFLLEQIYIRPGRERSRVALAARGGEENGEKLAIGEAW